MLYLLLALLCPYLQNPKPTQMTVMWPSTNEQQTGWVEYGIDSLNQVARESVQGLWAAYSDINRVTLTHLQPATTYRYRVVTLDIVGQVYSAHLTYGDTTYSDVYQFTTPAVEPKAVSCLIFNDIHSGDTLIPLLLSNHALEVEKQDFFFFNGDMMQAIADRDKLVRRMLNPVSRYFAHQVPFLCTRGNHEYRNKYTRELTRYVTTPGSEDNHPFYYTFTWGPCFFIVLDSGLDSADTCRYYSGLSNTEAYRASQVSWLKQQFNSPACREAKFRVLLMHAPITSHPTDYSMNDCCRLFLDLCNQYKVDVAIAGHTHTAGILPADSSRRFPIVVGGGKHLTDSNPRRLPTIIQFQATEQQLDIHIWNCYHQNCGSLTLHPMERSEQIRQDLLNPNVNRVMVASHRADWRGWPENSLAAIESAIQIGVDIVELDLQLTADSQLIIMHDKTINRTTTGKGKISELTLDSIRHFHLKNGVDIQTTHPIPTLREALLLCKGRVLINLDKADRYFDLVMPILQETGTTRQIIMKGRKSADEVRQLYGKYLDDVIYMPVLNMDTPESVAAFEEHLAAQPCAFELCFRTNDQYVKAASKMAHGKSLIWINTLWDTLCGGHEDDKAYRDPDAHYGYLIDTLGARIIQTDRPQFLIDYLNKMHFSR